MKDFCKLFKSDKYGQIAVIRQENDDGEPEVRFFLKALINGLGVCSMAFSGKDDSKKSSDALDKFFNDTTQEKAEGVAKIFNDQMNDLGAERDK